LLDARFFTLSAEVDMFCIVKYVIGTMQIQ
jgi:hypothetical protein